MHPSEKIQRILNQSLKCSYAQTEVICSLYVHYVWYGKTKMVWLPDGEESPLNVLHMVKKVKDIFIRFGRMYERDRRTDRRTDIA